jgi:hypothetical protein
MTDAAAGAGVAAQSPQNVHSPREKSTSGKSPRPRVGMPVGPASRHVSHRVQRSTNSRNAQGKRTGALRPDKSPRKNRLREIRIEQLRPSHRCL